MMTTLHKSVVTCKSAQLILLLIYLIGYITILDDESDESNSYVSRRTEEVTTCFDDDWWAKLVASDAAPDVAQDPEKVELQQQEDPFDDLMLVVHRNGEGTPCGEMRSNLVQTLQETFQDEKECPTKEAVNNMYEMESILTRVLHRTVQSCSSSASATESADDPGRRATTSGFFGYCDMGKARTPILEDHSQLVPNYVQSSSNNNNNKRKQRSFLPCHFHTKAGVRLSSFSHLVRLARQAAQAPAGQDDETTTATATKRPRELHLYAVQAGRYFMFAPSYAGEIIDLSHVQGGDPQQSVYLQVLSVQPKVFDIVNFMHPINEGQELLETVLQETRDDLKLRRSVTGDADHINMERTSDTGWDTDSRVSQTLKRYVL